MTLKTGETMVKIQVEIHFTVYLNRNIILNRKNIGEHKRLFSKTLRKSYQAQTFEW